MAGELTSAVFRALQLVEQLVQPQPPDRLPQAYPQRAVLVVGAHGDHRPLEPWVADAGRREQELADQEAWVHHGPCNAPGREWSRLPCVPRRARGAATIPRSIP